MLPETVGAPIRASRLNHASSVKMVPSFAQKSDQVTHLRAVQVSCVLYTRKLRCSSGTSHIEDVHDRI